MENKLFDSINIKTIEKLAGIVSANELSEITIKVGACVLTAVASFAMGMSMPAAIQTSAAVQPESAVSESRETVEGNVVKSPIVGTFYQAPSPDKPPFVKVGDTVKKGDVIMIIESMKLMNGVRQPFMIIK